MVTLPRHVCRFRLTTKATKLVLCAVMLGLMVACETPATSPSGKKPNLSGLERSRVETLAARLEPPLVDYTIARVYARRCDGIGTDERRFEREFDTIEKAMIAEGYQPFEIFDATYFLNGDTMADQVKAHFASVATGEEAFCANGLGLLAEKNGIGRFLR